MALGAESGPLDSGLESQAVPSESGRREKKQGRMGATCLSDEGYLEWAEGQWNNHL